MVSSSPNRKPPLRFYTSQATDGIFVVGLPLPRQLVIVFHRFHFVLSSPCLSSLLGMFGSDGVSSAGTNWNQRVFVSSGPPVRRDRSVIALGALDLLLVADCAWIWVKSKIRDPTEASTSRAVSLLLRRLAPAGLF